MGKKKAEFRLDEDRERAVAYRTCCLYFDKTARGLEMTAEQIAAKINEEFGEQLSRQMIYPMLERAKEFGFLQLMPPLSSALAEKVSERFGLSTEAIRVVNIQGKWDQLADRTWAGRQVASAGAELVMALIKEVWRNKPAILRDVIRVGLGPGRATFDFSRRLSELILSDADAPPIELIAITAGGDANHPEYASASFCNLFPTNRVKFIGLFAETLVPADELRSIFQRTGVIEAYSKRDAIDIVISSMGDPRDEHDLLTRFLTTARVKIPVNCVGNMQYRPYSASKPIVEKGRQLRAVTLFELSDFRDMVTRTRNRHVVLLARACGLCEITRATALRPLLNSEELKVWSHIVTDVATATELLNKDPD